MEDTRWKQIQELTEQTLTAMQSDDWSTAESLQAQRQQLIQQWITSLQSQLTPSELRRHIDAIQALDSQIGQFAQSAIDGALQTSRRQVNADKAIKHYRTQSRNK